MILILLTHVTKAQGKTVPSNDKPVHVEIMVNNESASTKGGFCVVKGLDRVKILIHNISATDLNDVIIHTCQITQTN